MIKPGDKFTHHTGRVAVIDAVETAKRRPFTTMRSKKPNGWNITFHYEDDGKPLKLSKSLFLQGHKPL